MLILYIELHCCYTAVYLPRFELQQGTYGAPDCANKHVK